MKVAEPQPIPPKVAAAKDDHVAAAGNAAQRKSDDNLKKDGTKIGARYGRTKYENATSSSLCFEFESQTEILTWVLKSCGT